MSGFDDDLPAADAASSGFSFGDAGDGDDAAVAPPPMRGRRRFSVSAEVDDDDGAGAGEAAAEARVSHPKSDEERAQVAAVLGRMMLFQRMRSDYVEEVIDSLAKCPFAVGDVVISQGAEGDRFFIIQSGAFAVFKDENHDDYEGPVTAPAAGKKFGVLHSGDYFGEIALMYNTPRLASIVCEEAGVCWATDRATFRRVLRTVFNQERDRYNSFIASVPLFDGMEYADKLRLSDAFSPEVFRDGDVVVKQGDEGDRFYVIENGETSVERDGQVVNHLKRGDFFGERALLTNERRLATVIAVGSLRAAYIDKATFSELVPQAVREKLMEAAAHYKAPSSH